MVSNQKEHRDHTLAVWKLLPEASYGNALKGDLKLDVATGEIRFSHLRLLLDMTPSL